MHSKKGRYWIFAYNEPIGGMEDFQFSFNTVEEFEEEISKIAIKFHRFQVLNTETRYHFTGDVGTVIKWVCKNIGGEIYE
jgi:hypothetical protein